MLLFACVCRVDARASATKPSSTALCNRKRRQNHCRVHCHPSCNTAAVPTSGTWRFIFPPHFNFISASSTRSRFVIECRLSDGIGLLTQFTIPSPPQDLGFGSTVHRAFRSPTPSIASPKKTFLGSGSSVSKPPVVPLLIREVLLAPEAPPEAAIMMEAA